MDSWLTKNKRVVLSPPQRSRGLEMGSGRIQGDRKFRNRASFPFAMKCLTRKWIPGLPKIKGWFWPPPQRNGGLEVGSGPIQGDRKFRNCASFPFSMNRSSRKWIPASPKIKGWFWPPPQRNGGLEMGSGPIQGDRKFRNRASFPFAMKRLSQKWIPGLPKIKGWFWPPHREAVG